MDPKFQAQKQLGSRGPWLALGSHLTREDALVDVHSDIIDRYKTVDVDTFMRDFSTSGGITDLANFAVAALEPNVDQIAFRVIDRSILADAWIVQ